MSDTKAAELGLTPLARIVSTGVTALSLINSLGFHDKQFGLETMCVGGGQGMAMILERLS